MVGWLRRSRRPRAGGDARPSMFDSMWLTLHESGSSGVSVEVSRRWAMRASVEDFAALYRTSVASAKRGEAEAWAREQVATREAVLSA